MFYLLKEVGGGIYDKATLPFDYIDEGKYT